MRTEGEKHDADKLRWDLLPIDAVEDIVRVLTFGAKKYSPNNWKKVSDPENRYYAAAMRHLAEYRKGNPIDSETGLPHLAHAGCCLLFLSFFQDFKKVKVDWGSNYRR